MSRDLFITLNWTDLDFCVNDVYAGLTFQENLSEGETQKSFQKGVCC